MQCHYDHVKSIVWLFSRDAALLHGGEESKWPSKYSDWIRRHSSPPCHFPSFIRINIRSVSNLPSPHDYIQLRFVLKTTKIRLFTRTPKRALFCRGVSGLSAGSPASSLTAPLLHPAAVTTHRPLSTKMSSDADYASFLERANASTSSGSRTAEARSDGEDKTRIKLRATAAGNEKHVPREIHDAIKERVYVSESDEEFDGVSLVVGDGKGDGQGSLDESKSTMSFSLSTSGGHVHTDVVLASRDFCRDGRAPIAKRSPRPDHDGAGLGPTWTAQRPGRGRRKSMLRGQRGRPGLPHCAWGCTMRVLDCGIVCRGRTETFGRRPCDGGGKLSTWAVYVLYLYGWRIECTRFSH